MRSWESDVAIYLLAGFMALALFIVAADRLQIDALIARFF